MTDSKEIEKAKKSWKRIHAARRGWLIKWQEREDRKQRKGKAG